MQPQIFANIFGGMYGHALMHSSTHQDCFVACMLLQTVFDVHPSQSYIALYPCLFVSSSVLVCTLNCLMSASSGPNFHPYFVSLSRVQSWHIKCLLLGAHRNLVAILVAPVETWCINYLVIVVALQCKTSGQLHACQLY